MAYRSVSNFRETATAKPTEAGETIRRTYLWELNKKGEKVLTLDQTIDQQAEIDSYLEETKLENIIRRASIDPDLAARLVPDMGGGLQDATQMPENLMELQNIMLRAFPCDMSCKRGPSKSGMKSRRKSSSSLTTTSINSWQASELSTGQRIWESIRRNSLKSLKRRKPLNEQEQRRRV
jgi:hypothetical protein